MIKMMLPFLMLAACVFGQMRQTVSVDQNGNIEPSGYIAGLTDIARAEAMAATATQSVLLAQQTMIDASNIVNEVVAALTGTYGFGYVTGFVVSFSGAVAVDTNVMSYIDYFQPGMAGTMMTNGVQHSGHYVWHHYTAAMNTTPFIKYKRVLGATNSWEFAEVQVTDQFTDVTVNGVHYDVLYKSTVWLPSEYDTAFFMAFCEILPGGQAGAPLDIKGGITINGEKMLDEVYTNANGRVETHVSGFLKRVDYVTP